MRCRQLRKRSKNPKNTLNQREGGVKNERLDAYHFSHIFIVSCGIVNSAWSIDKKVGIAMWQEIMEFISGKKQGKGTIGAERRKMHRISIILTINCRLAGKADSFRILTENMNILGLKFITSYQLEAGQSLKMSVLLYSHVPAIEAVGKVVWSEKKVKNGLPLFEGGIKFTSIGNDNARFLDRYLNKYSIAQYDSPQNLQ
jgi:hypothetical protein